MTKRKKEQVGKLAKSKNKQKRTIGFQPNNNIPTSSEEMQILTSKQVQKEKDELGIVDTTKRELIKFTGCSDFINNKPKNTEYLFKNLMPANIVGAILATGGTGKTFLSLQLAGSLATGQKLGIFEPQQKRKVLFIGGEDHKEILHKRLYSIFHNMEIFQEVAYDFGRNFTAISLCGEDTILTGYDDSGSNPITTKTFQWLEDSIASMEGLEVLIIDPKARFDGLNENDNTHATFFINALERLSKKFGLTILFVHHESKTTVQNGDVKNSTGRGASALRDGVRFTLSLAELGEKTAKYFDVNKHDYVECFTSKNNYAAKMKTSAYFKRGEDGVLIPEDLNKTKKTGQVMELVRLLNEATGNVTRRGLSRTGKNEDENTIQKALKEFGVKSLRSEIDGIINTGINKCLIFEKNIQAKTGKTIKVLTTKA